MTNNECPNLPIRDHLYPRMSLTSRPMILLDEAENTELIGFCNEKHISYIINIDNNNKNIKISLDLYLEGDYNEVKKAFPNVKVLGIDAGATIKYLYDLDIKNFYENTVANRSCMIIAPVSKILSSDLMELFTYSYCTYNHRCLGYNILLPDLNTYNKLALILGGADNFRLYQILRKG